MVPNSESSFHLPEAYKALFEKCIHTEVRRYFPEMNLYHTIQAYGVSLVRDDVDASVADHISPSDRKLLELERERLSFSEGGSFSRPNFDIVIKSGSSKVVFCETCTTLKGFYTVWALTNFSLSVKASKSEENESKNGCRKRGRPHQSSVHSTSSVSKVSLMSLHIVPIVIKETQYSKDRSMKRNDINRLAKIVMCGKSTASFAIQSIFQVGFPNSLECYTKHFVYFSALIFFLWNEEWIYGPSKTDTTRLVSPNKRKNARCPYTTSSELAPSLYRPSAPPTSVLVLGIGGNVLGKVLDRLLPLTTFSKPLSSVSIDCVELEPSILTSGALFHRIPLNLSAPLPIGKSGLKWSHTTDIASEMPVNQHVNRSNGFYGGGGMQEDVYLSNRIPDHRFIVGDAYQFLSLKDCEVNGNGGFKVVKYNTIYLDCYDPYKEEMVFQDNKDSSTSHESIIFKCFLKLRDEGGILVINAHVHPTVDSLRDVFHFCRGQQSIVGGEDHCRFASIHVLRVEGCTQSVIIGVKDTRCSRLESESNDTRTDHKRSRFTIGNSKKVFQLLNNLFSAQEADNRFAKHGFRFDVNWLKRCEEMKNPYNIPCKIWTHC